MHDNRAGKVVELRAEAVLEPGLEAVSLIPGNAFEEGIDEADDEEGGGELRIEARTLGDAAGNDGWNRGGEGQQEEELGECVAIMFGQHLGTTEEVHAIGNAVADKEIGEVETEKSTRILTRALTWFFYVRYPAQERQSRHAWRES